MQHTISTSEDRATRTTSRAPWDKSTGGHSCVSGGGVGASYGDVDSYFGNLNSISIYSVPPNMTATFVLPR